MKKTSLFLHNIVSGVKIIIHRFFPDQCSSFVEFIRKTKERRLPVLVKEKFFPFVENHSEDNFSRPCRGWISIHLEGIGNEESNSVVYDEVIGCYNPIDTGSLIQVNALAKKREEELKQKLSLFNIPLSI